NSSLCPHSFGKASFQALQSPSHPGLYRTERLLQMVRELRMRQTMKVCEHDTLPLLGVQLPETACERAFLTGSDQALPRSRRLVLPGFHRDVVFLARGLGLGAA